VASKATTVRKPLTASLAWPIITFLSAAILCARYLSGRSATPSSCPALCGGPRSPLTGCSKTPQPNASRHSSAASTNKRNCSWLRKTTSPRPPQPFSPSPTGHRVSSDSGLGGERDQPEAGRPEACGCPGTAPPRRPRTHLRTRHQATSPSRAPTRQRRPTVWLPPPLWRPLLRGQHTVWAYVGHVDAKSGPWDDLHSNQETAPDVSFKVAPESVKYRTAEDPLQSCRTCAMFNGGMCDRIVGRVEDDHLRRVGGRSLAQATYVTGSRPGQSVRRVRPW
jgi:hypothetical protein